MKEPDPIASDPGVAEYIAQQVPIPAFANVAPMATDAGRVGDIARELGTPRRYEDPPVIRRHPWQVSVAGQSAAGAWPTLRCAWGQVLKTDQAVQAIEVSDRTTNWTAAAGQLIWIEVYITDDGDISSATLKHGTPASEGWTAYPTCYEADSTGNYWYHPIAEIREALDPWESGEVLIYSSGGTDYVIAQLESNHLRTVRMCNMDGVPFWMLQPGPGGRRT